jgi:hypothetical protein
MIGWEPGMVEGRICPRRGAVAGVARGWKSGRDMVGIRCALIIRLVARVAVRRHGRVVVVHMAARARHSGMCSRQWECSVVVIETRRLPCSSVVADFALLWEAGLHMVRIRRSVEIIEVARYACSVVQTVVAIHVALRTLQAGMRSGQRKSGRRVIERRARPRCRAVAGVASRWERCLHVVRIGCGLVILHVT